MTPWESISMDWTYCILLQSLGSFSSRLGQGRSTWCPVELVTTSFNVDHTPVRHLGTVAKIRCSVHFAATFGPHTFSPVIALFSTIKDLSATAFSRCSVLSQSYSTVTHSPTTVISAKSSVARVVAWGILAICSSRSWFSSFSFPSCARRRAFSDSREAAWGLAGTVSPLVVELAQTIAPTVAVATRVPTATAPRRARRLPPS
mmetsp:Transcript_79189/g.211707  ORF Transcript_79189/g.211707 Transcript_79189/m.211707 type:complete len:203 (-) Transcript_79189:168-776(-)